jgi:hypothetical protein
MRHALAVLVLGASLSMPPGLEAASGPGPAPQAPIERVTYQKAAANAPLPIGIEADVYCSGWLGDPNEKFLGTVASAEKIDNQQSFLTGDIVYLDIGTADGVDAGQEFWVVRPGRTVYQWSSVREELGRIYETPGRVRVLCAQERSAIAEIVYGCAEVEVGDRLLAFEPIPIPLVRRTRLATLCDVPNGKALGHIVDSKDTVTPLGAGTIVYLDLGEEDGVSAGDFLTVFRVHVRVTSVRTILGEAAVLMTRAHTAVAILTLSNDVMGVGDEVELK